MAGTTYIGQFTDENADRIVDAFDDAGIRWHAKSSGRFVRVIFAADWGVRLFVEDARLADAREIAVDIAPDGLTKR